MKLLTYLGAGALIFKRSRGKFFILLCEWNKTPYKGCWGLPSALQQDGEAKLDTALRSVQQCLGVNPRVLGKKMGSYKIMLPHFKWEAFIFEATTNLAAKPQLDAGITKCQWVASDNLHRYRIHNFPREAMEYFVKLVVLPKYF